MNGGVGGEKETSFTTQDKDVHTGIVGVEYETREASAKFEADFKYTQGTLVRFSQVFF